jgi:pimeloyl-[acyl-carrier protein] methyl ester esterase
MVVRDFLGTLFSPTEQSSAISFQQQCEQTFTKINPAALSAGLNYLLTAELTGRLGAISCPVLLLHGSADTVIDLRLAESLAAALPDSRLEMLEGAGHAPLWSRAETCAYLAAEFVETLG